MADPFSNVDYVDAPARKMFLITPDDTQEINPIPKAIRADNAGTVTLRAVSSLADVQLTMAAGEVLPVRAKYIRVTGTTVTVIHGMV